MCVVVSCGKWYPTFERMNPILKLQGLGTAVFTIGPKGERLNSTSMPSRQLASLGLKVKD